MHRVKVDRFCNSKKHLIPKQEFVEIKYPESDINQRIEDWFENMKIFETSFK